LCLPIRYSYLIMWFLLGEITNGWYRATMLQCKLATILHLPHLWIIATGKRTERNFYRFTWIQCWFHSWTDYFISSPEPNGISLSTKLTYVSGLLLLSTVIRVNWIYQNSSQFIYSKLNITTTTSRILAHQRHKFRDKNIPKTTAAN
jgi:hypothetical protein